MINNNTHIIVARTPYFTFCRPVKQTLQNLITSMRQNRNKSWSRCFEFTPEAKSIRDLLYAALRCRLEYSLLEKILCDKMLEKSTFLNDLSVTEQIIEVLYYFNEKKTSVENLNNFIEKLDETAPDSRLLDKLFFSYAAVNNNWVPDEIFDFLNSAQKEHLRVNANEITSNYVILAGSDNRHEYLLLRKGQTD